MFGKKSQRHTKQDDNQKLITDFGTRKILSQNFSRLVVIPKVALLNCGLREASLVNIKLVQENDTKYIVITPIHNADLEEI